MSTSVNILGNQQVPLGRFEAQSSYANTLEAQQHANFFGAQQQYASPLEAQQQQVNAVTAQQTSAVPVQQTPAGDALRGKIMRHYAIAAAACLAFAFIYAQFSHGVYSPFMTWMFVIPLAFGAIAEVALRLLGSQSITGTARKLWGLSAATFTIASCLRGIFEIAGTGSVWLYAYLVVGAALALAAIFTAKRQADRSFC